MRYEIAVAWAQAANGVLELVGIVSQVRRQLGTRIEADHNCFVFFPDDAVNKVRRGFLHGVACSYVSFVIATQAKYGIQPE